MKTTSLCQLLKIGHQISDQIKSCTFRSDETRTSTPQSWSSNQDLNSGFLTSCHSSPFRLNFERRSDSVCGCVAAAVDSRKGVQVLLEAEGTLGARCGAVISSVQRTCLC